MEKIEISNFFCIFLNSYALSFNDREQIRARQNIISDMKGGGYLISDFIWQGVEWGVNNFFFVSCIPKLVLWKMVT